MDITTSHVTHSGRHSGSVEGQRLSVPEEDIRRAGRWVQGTGKMHQYYLSSLPIPFARSVARFRTRPFHLKRNQVAPSISLQELVFPFIVSAYDAQGEKASARWKMECIDEMNEIGDDDEDENLDKEIQDFRDRWMDIKVSQGGQTAARTLGIAKKNFLKLLLRLRRIILQDAVVYLEAGLDGPILDHDILRGGNRPDQEFESFSSRAQQSETQPRNQRFEEAQALGAMFAREDVLNQEHNNRVAEQARERARMAMLARQDQPRTF